MIATNNTAETILRSSIEQYMNLINQKSGKKIRVSIENGVGFVEYDGKIVMNSSGFSCGYTIEAFLMGMCVMLYQK
jgi:hypothetical protein